MSFPRTICLLVSATLLAAFVLAGDQCYYLNGQPAGGVYRCDNTTSGESSCCNAGQICYSNGVCQAGPENHATDWLRVGCTDKTWSSPACLKQCTNLVPSSSAGIRPCGGILLSDQYCCDTQGKGPGSLACCSNATNIFAVDPIPHIIATIPLNPIKAASSGSSSSSSSNSGLNTSLIPFPTVSSTVTVTSASTTATATLAAANSTTYASSNIPSNSYYFTSSNSTVTSTSLTTAPGSTSTTPAAASSSSSGATSLGALDAGVSWGIILLSWLVSAL